jgi:hypothetical protein
LSESVLLNLTDDKLEGAFLGNQQFTTRNMTFNGCKTAIFMNWNWAWTFKSLNIKICGIGVDMSNGLTGGVNQTVGSVLILDSKMTNTPKGIVTAYSGSSAPETGGTLVLDNVDFTGSSIAVARPDESAILAGGSVVASWGQGNVYMPAGRHYSNTTTADGTGAYIQALRRGKSHNYNGGSSSIDPNSNQYAKARVQGAQTAPTKPAVLLKGRAVFERAKPCETAIRKCSCVLLRER